MYNVIQYGKEAFILFTFPLIGLALQRRMSKNQMYWLLAISFILIAPVFATYGYSVPYLLRISILALLSATFAIYIHAEAERKFQVRTAWIMSAVLFFLLGFFAILDGVAGHQTVQKTWYVDDYKIEYIKDQGFAGGPLMKYQLNKYGILPLYINKLR